MEDSPIEFEIGVNHFRETIQAVHALVEEARLQLSDEGLRIQAVEPANVGSIDLELDSQAFSIYEVEEQEICIDVSRFIDILQKADAEQTLRFEFDGEDNKIDLEFGEYAFDLRPLASEAVRDVKSTPDFSPPAKATIFAHELREAVELADMFSDHIIIGMDEDTEFLYMAARGDSDGMHASYAPEELVEVDAGPAHSIYSLSYLDMITRPVPDKKEIVLQIGEESLAKINFEIANENGLAEYTLAPRIS